MIVRGLGMTKAVLFDFGGALDSDGIQSAVVSQFESRLSISSTIHLTS